MNQKGLICAMLLVLALSGCSVMDENTGGGREDIIITGEPAIDAAAIFYTTEELKALNLYRPSAALSTAASTATFSVIVNGPLSDRRLVRGKKLAVSAVRYGTAPEGEIYYVYYGLSTSTVTNRQELKATGYGNIVAIFDLPYSATAQRFYYRIKGSKGTVYDNAGAPFSMAIYDSAVSLRMQDGRLTLNYSGKAAGFNGSIHAGWNNWNNIFDAGMNYIDYPIAKYAQPGGYSTVSLSVPWWADYMDFVFWLNGSCDNNASKDWHYSMKPLVDANVSGSYNGKKLVNIYYANGSLNPVVAHYGYNGWLGVKDQELSYSYAGQWSGTAELPESSTSLDVCFRDHNNNWNNNFGKNWSFQIK